MGKNKNLQESASQNFILRGFNSILIGAYIVLGAFLIKSFIENFVADSNPMGMMSIEIIEFLCFFMIVLVFLFSSTAIFFSNRRKLRKLNQKVWNKSSKKQCWIFLITMTLGIIALKIIKSFGYINYLTPFVLIYVGAILARFNQRKKQDFYLLSVLSALLAVITVLIPHYWYSALVILGISFMTYGVINRK